MDQVKIGKFIAQLRKEQGLTQNQLAEKLNISNRTVSKWETGNGLPDVSLLTPLCTVLNITSDELFAGERISALHNEEVLKEIKEEPKKKKPNIMITVIAVILILSLCALATCKFMGKDDKEKGTPRLSPTGTNIVTPDVTPAITLTELPANSDAPEITATPETSLMPETSLTPTVITPLITPTAQIVYVTPPFNQTAKPTQTPFITNYPIVTPTSTLKPTPTATVTPTITATPTLAPTPTPTVAPTPKPTFETIPSSKYGGYKFTSIAGRQSQWPYYYINCGMNDSPLGKYSDYTGTITLQYKVYNPTDETIKVQLHVQTLYDNFWCYMFYCNYDIVTIEPKTIETVTAKVPIENGNIEFSRKGIVEINAEKTFLRFDVYFDDLAKAGNQVVIFANSADDIILTCEWYSTGYMIPERIY